MTASIWRVDIVVLPKNGVSDPQGEAVKSGLGLLGIGGVDRIRVGRHLEVDVAADDEAAARSIATTMSEKLLANLVIEQFRIDSIQELQPTGSQL
jgi:phosphoribosylformylglycinamidine synthase PurS subunit